MNIIAAQQLKQKAENNQARKAEMRLRLDYYQDNQIEDLLSELDKHFKDPSKFQLVICNITKKIINKLAMIYKQPAVRTIVDGTKEDETIFNEIWEGAKVNVTMKKINRYTKLLKTILVRPVWRDEKIEYDIYPPFLLDVEQKENDLTQAEALLISQPGKVDTVEAEKVFYTYWSDTETFSIDAFGKIQSDPDNPDHTNPYEILPFTKFDDSLPDSGYFLTGGEDLIITNRVVNLMLTDLRWNILMGCFGQPVSIGANISSLGVGPGSLINLQYGPNGEKPEFDYKTPKPIISEVLKAIEFQIKMLAVNSNLSPAMFEIEKKAALSGISKIIDNIDMIEARQDDIELYRSFEKNLFDITRAVYNYHNPNRQISDKAKLEIDFAEIGFHRDPKEEAEVWEKEIATGVASILDWIMKKNPDIQTKEDAMKVLKENLEVRNQAAKFFNSNKGGEEKTVSKNVATQSILEKV